MEENKVQLTPRQEALRIIQMGESVVVNGKQYTFENVNELPDESAFIGNDEQARENAQRAVEAEIARLQEIQRRLAPAKVEEPKVEEPKAEPKKKVEDAK